MKKGFASNLGSNWGVFEGKLKLPILTFWFLRGSDIGRFWASYAKSAIFVLAGGIFFYWSFEGNRVERMELADRLGGEEGRFLVGWFKTGSLGGLEAIYG